MRSPRARARRLVEASLINVDSTDFQTKKFGPSDLCIISEFAQFLRPDGVLRVPPGHVGHILYGPYIELATGWYHAILDIDAGPGVVFDVYAAGQVFIERPAASTAVWIHIRQPVEKLEFRLSVRGGALTFRGLELRGVEAPDADHDPQAVAVVDLPVSAETVRARKLTKLWKAIHGRSREAVKQLVHAVDEADLAAWSMKTPRARVIEAWNDASLTASAAEVANLGLDIDALRDCAKDDFVSEAAFASRAGQAKLAAELLQHADFPETDFISPFLQSLAQGHGAIQFTGLTAGLALCPCPFTGAVLVSRHAVPIACDDAKQSHIFHYFDGGTPFYLVVGGFGGRKAYIYVPDLEVILQIGQPQFDWGTHQPFIDLLRIAVTRDALAYFDYLAGDTRKAILAGTINNLGHYFWNDIAGLVRHARAGLLQAVNHVLTYRFAFLGPELGLEESSGLKIARARDAQDLFQTTLSNGFYCVRPTALRITAETAAKVRNHAEKRFEPEQRARVAAARKSDFLVWFNLRAHNKVWLDQVEAAVALAERVTREGHTLSLVLDGMADCEALAAEIRGRIPQGVLVVDGFDMPFHQSVCWAFACDAYVATIGSGLTMTTWIAGRPGVAHSERAHMNQMEFWSEVRPDVPPPLTAPLAEIRDQGVGAYCDYHIDPPFVVEALWSQLAKLARAKQLANSET